MLQQNICLILNINCALDLIDLVPGSLRAGVVVAPEGAERVPVEGQVDEGVHQAVQGHQPEQRLQLLTNLLLEPAATN